MVDFRYLEQFTNFETRRGHIRDFKLETMEKLLDDFGKPHEGMKFIHIAGSKGKGSTSAYTAALLSDYLNERVGIYGSPHVYDYRERIRSAVPGMTDIRQGFFRDEIYGRNLNRIKKYIDGLPGDAEHPSTFELLTLLSFLVFQEAGLRHAVIEVGMGGRLDSTNVIQPVICGITPIEMEHAKYLGDTLEKIAGEKAGIIKPGIPVISGRQKPGAGEVIRRRAAERGSPLFTIQDDSGSVDYLKENFRLATKLFIEIPGIRDHNLTGYPEPEDFLMHSASGIFSRTRLPGRYEARNLPGCGSPVILDAAHTPDSLERFFTALQADPELKTDGQTAGYCIFAALEDKDRRKMLEIVLKYFSRIIFCGTGSFKPSDPRELAAIAERLPGAEKAEIRVAESPSHALRMACSMNSWGAACGSFYLLGELYPELVPEK
ncbi:bifunctional folylpolyglutamate synthase/dihydrofolate synthase [Salinispira pacifica]|uniref:Dihydrofolate synthase/folylpolyglutamate synthase n=1 Tax=Salinispira pacifica TaxID=1307761 RepID=V5WGT6_9SPIO|nr:Mur ligase family protein [Salinispira pacifica]AHC14998.1 Dihydrofolate synthase/ Folylpolyglutamate synthase [Salinispira pacifica]